MKNKIEIVGKIRELLNVNGVGLSDSYKHNIQGMIESLYWVIDEDVDDELKDKIEGII